MITLGLASTKFINNDIAFNVQQMKRMIDEAKAQDCDLVCFGEAFLQGFDAFNWNYANDKTIAFTLQHPVIQDLIEYSCSLKIDLAFGYLEREDETLYSSYVFIEKGIIRKNYRRVSRGWKEFTITDDHYQEGNDISAFSYHDHSVVMALCGDLWDKPNDFMLGQSVTLWPVYVDFTLPEWDQYRLEYAEQVANLTGDVLLINSHSSSSAVGGCFHFREGRIISELAPGSEGLHVVQIGR